MDLLEYQAKELFSEVGIPILPSQTLSDPTELKRLQIPYPVVLKSQVRAGGRGKAGGVRFVETTIDAIAAARAIFNLSIMGEYPEVVLAEARYNTDKEFFLAVLLDYQLQRPVLLGSAAGGIDIDNLLEHLKKVVVEEEFSPFYARRLAIQMGLQGALIESVSTIIEKIYSLFIKNDLDLVEINPLGVSAEGEVMALDGKISVNDNALDRHSQLVSLTSSQKLTDELPDSGLARAIASPELHWLDGIDRKGSVGIIGSSLGLALIAWDILVQEKAKPAACLVIGKGTCPIAFPPLLIRAIEQMTEISGLQSILVNVLGDAETIREIAGAIADYLETQSGQTLNLKGQERMPRATSAVSSGRTRTNSSRKSQSLESPQLILRLAGGDLTPFQERFAALSIQCTENLDEAIALSVAKSKAH